MFRMLVLSQYLSEDCRIEQNTELRGKLIHNPNPSIRMNGVLTSINQYISKNKGYSTQREK